MAHMNQAGRYPQTERKPGLLARLFGTREKANLPVPSNRGWGWRVLEPFAGAWQRNIEWSREDVSAHYAVFGCVTLIASDISKMRIRLMREDSRGLTVEVNDVRGMGLDVLIKPNSYQNRKQFLECWVISKLLRGNAYILKQRDSRGRVIGLTVLNPDLVLPMVTTSGDVYYQLGADNLTGVTGSGVTVPASEIIHDRFNCFYHPLVGLSPLYACGLAAYQGIKIQENSAKLFANMSRPAGILTAPGNINDDTAARLKQEWEANYGGENFGRTAVLGDGLKYEAITMTPDDAQLVDQMKLGGEIVCSAFHVPKYKIISDAPSYNNVEALNQQYMGQCLQVHIEDIELLLDEGLAVPSGYYTEFDTSGLLRMDTKSKIETLVKAVGGGIMTPNTALMAQNLQPVDGGDTVYMQQQQFSLAALAKRDARPDPFAKNADSNDTPSATNARQVAVEDGTDGQDTANARGFDGIAFLTALQKNLGVRDEA